MKWSGKRKKRAVMLSATCALCATILFNGTFAWSSVGQDATNEVKGRMENPGGRLHDDFNGKNKDVYIENFTNQYDGQPIIVRMRLREYMNTSVDDQTSIPTWASWDIWDPAENIKDGYYESPTGYWKWKLGGKTTYLPTFNKDKDSEDADLNGTFAGPDNDASNGNDAFDDYIKYALNTPIEDTAYYDNHETKTETHVVAETQSATMMSMAEWKANPQLGNYWVYDDDGWAYWAQPLWPDSATGLLLDEIRLIKAVSGSWYYGIHVESEMVSVDELTDIDAAKTNKTGFYHDHAAGSGACSTCEGECPSASALTLLQAIVTEIGDEPTITYQWMEDLYTDFSEDEEEDTEVSEGRPVVIDLEDEDSSDVTVSDDEEEVTTDTKEPDTSETDEDETVSADQTDDTAADEDAAGEIRPAQTVDLDEAENEE